LIRVVSCVLAAGLSLFCAACVQKDFGPDKANALLAAQPVRLDAELLGLKNEQVYCGVREELWDPPTELGERAIARLTEKGRALKFDDDVVIQEPGFQLPHVQVRGEFSIVGTDQAGSIHEVDPATRDVENRVAVRINHTCFPDPLPLLGVRHGRFAEDAIPVMRFELGNDGWRFVRILH